MAARRSLFSLLSKAAQAAPGQLALVSPFQPGPLEALTFAQLRSAAGALSGFLRERGLGRRPGEVLVSDLPNTAENVLLQLACSRLGVAYGTAKDAAGLAALAKAGRAVRGVAAATQDSWLLSAAPAGLDPLLGTEMAEMLREAVEAGDNTFVDEGADGPAAGGGAAEDLPHAYFGSTRPLMASALVDCGEAAAAKLGLGPADAVCVGITLCHQFGIGSGVGAALASGAKLVLPAVGGIRGCGVPSERAEATLQVLRDHQVTCLFADTHVVNELRRILPPEVPSRLALRKGVVKTGSGADFLDERAALAGASLWTMGKAP